MIWKRPYLLSPSLENKCSGKGTYALLVGEKRVCFALPSGSAQRSPTEHRICSPVLLLLMWQFQVFIKNIWNHWGYSVRILKHRHQSFYIQTRADSYNFAFREYFLFPLRTYSKTLFIIDNRLEQQFLRDWLYLPSPCVLHLLSLHKGSWILQLKLSGSLLPRVFLKIPQMACTNTLRIII